jgi:hypothetical protein
MFSEKSHILSVVAIKHPLQSRIDNLGYLGGSIFVLSEVSSRRRINLLHGMFY